jgi:pimeloyl-ACP methyl ester carboxylesterase
MLTTTSPGTASVPRPTPRRPRAARWLRRALLWPLVALLALAGSGALYQALATARDTRAYPPPGRLVDIGGHRLHLYCVGTGSPTVVLEAVAGGTSADWAWVQPEVAATTRVCAYDRAGRGWSDHGPGPRDARRVATELHTLLGNAGEPGPYVLVGHSLGGLFVRQFAAQYPDEVAGMVLIDARHPDTFTRSTPTEQAAERADMRRNRIGAALAPFGVLRLYFRFQDPAPGLAERQRAEVRAFLSSTRFWQSWRAEQAAQPDTEAQVRGADGLGATPLLVVTAGERLSATWAALQEELATRSSNSTHRVIAGATHLSLAYDQQDARQSSAAILDVVAAARTGQPLAR